MVKPNRKLVQGTLDMLILKALCHGAQHGYGIARRIEQLAADALIVEEGSLYPALHRIEQQGWIKSKWKVSEKNQQARYYSLTASGRKQLEQEEASWIRLSDAIRKVLVSA
jgi:PadR family transcriptional regulator PadR